jgi:osmotically-inducible protein OsmY
MKLFAFSSCAVAVLLVSGCSRQEQARTEQTLNRAGRTTAATLKKAGKVTVKTLDRAGDLTADAALTTAVKTRLLADKWIGATGIDVSTKNGAVTLSGTIASQQQKARATKIARETAGVRGVANRLQIKK